MADGTFIGWQERPRDWPLPLFILDEPIGDQPAGSTASALSFLEAGLEVPGIPCGGEPLVGCPRPSTTVAFFSGAAGVFLPDAVPLCDGHRQDYARDVGAPGGPVVMVALGWVLGIMLDCYRARQAERARRLSPDPDPSQ